MRSKVLMRSWFTTCCALALAGCNNDDGGDDAGTADTGTGGTTDSGTDGGASGESGGTPGGGSGGSAGASGTSTFDADCANMCELEATCAARGAGGAGGESGAPPPSTDECLMLCALIGETLPDEICRAETEAYFACIGRIEPDTAVCVDGVPNWDQYCLAELAASEDCP